MEASLIISKPVYLEEKFIGKSLKIIVPKSLFAIVLLFPSLVLCRSITLTVTGSISVAD